MTSPKEPKLTGMTFEGPDGQPVRGVTVRNEELAHQMGELLEEWIESESDFAHHQKLWFSKTGDTIDDVHSVPEGTPYDRKPYAFRLYVALHRALGRTVYFPILPSNPYVEQLRDLLRDLGAVEHELAEAWFTVNLDPTIIPPPEPDPAQGASLEEVETYLAIMQRQREQLEAIISDVDAFVLSLKTKMDPDEITVEMERARVRAAEQRKKNETLRRKLAKKASQL